MGETQRARLQTLRQQGIETRLKQWRLSGTEFGRRLRCLRQAHRRDPARCQARTRHRPEMPQAVNANLHDRASTTHGLAIKYSNVLITPLWIDNLGDQPSARIRLQSRKMNGLSPIQPRSPPVYSSLGFSCRRLQIQPID